MTDQLTRPASADAAIFEGVDCLAQGPTSALIATRVHSAAEEPLCVRWEVFAEGEREPVRYGLCLARPADEFRVRVPVMGLKVGQPYQFQFQLGSAVSEPGSFRTTQSHFEAMQSGSLAA